MSSVMRERLPRRLEGRLVTLEVLGPEHQEGLRAAGADPEVWRWMRVSDVDTWLRLMLAGNDYAFAILRDGIPVGSSSYLSIVPEHRRLEIGNTWMHPSTWGSGPPTNASPSIGSSTDGSEDVASRRRSKDRSTTWLASLCTAPDASHQPAAWFVVSTTSVSPSQWPIESPWYKRDWMNR